MSMYYNDDGSIDTRWVDSEARAVAEQLVPVNAYGSSEPAIKSSQLRRFYADVKNLEQIWNNQQKSDVAFLGILPQIKILKAKANYAKSRTVVPTAFVQWMERHVDAVNTARDFKVFLLHFEAVVGFCYGLGLKDS